MATDYTIRTLTADDLVPFAEVLAMAFLAHAGVDEVAEAEATVFEPDRSHAVVAPDGAFAGVGQILTRTVTVPGGHAVPVAAVTSVGVRSDHRRRGVLTRIMREQLHGVHEAGLEPIAALWASESAIYGRFGYGLASDYVLHDITARTPYRPGIDLGTDTIRELPRDEAMPLIRPLYERYAAATVGALGRGDGHWAYRYLDGEPRRRGASPLRFAVHPDGYATFRVRPQWTDRHPNGTLSVHEFVATTPQAYAALMRYVLDVDLVGAVEFEGGVDEPLALILQTPREALRKRFDGLFIRLVDLDRALTARDYRSDVDVVLDVTDEFCPWNAGRWRFAVQGGKAVVEPTTADADLSTSTTELAAVYLGGPRLTALAAAGRVREHTPGAVARLSAAFQAEREPTCVEVF